MPKDIPDLATALSYTIDTGILEYVFPEVSSLLDRLQKLVSRLWYEMLREYLDIKSYEQLMAVVDIIAYNGEARCLFSFSMYSFLHLAANTKSFIS